MLAFMLARQIVTYKFNLKKFLTFLYTLIYTKSAESDSYNVKNIISGIKVNQQNKKEKKMNKIVYRVEVSENEEKFLEEKAGEKGLTIPNYIRSIVLAETEFHTRFEELKKGIENVPIGVKFNVRDVFYKFEWTSISRGVRLGLGRVFYNYIKDGNMSNIEALPEKDRDNVQLYIRKK